MTEWRHVRTRRLSTTERLTKDRCLSGDRLTKDPDDRANIIMPVLHAMHFQVASAPHTNIDSNTKGKTVSFIVTLLF